MSLLESIADVLLPRFCKVCGRRLAIGEQHLCVSCTLRLPVIQYRQGEISPTENVLLGEFAMVRAASLFRYEKESDYSHILYHLKYYGHPGVGRYLARQAASMLQREHFFDGISCIVPVPLSHRKLRKRGYNQCDYIASGLSQVTGLPIRTDIVTRTVSNQVQAKKGRLQRWRNAEGIFRVCDADSLRSYPHILIVDDVVTTGSTISSLIDTLRSSAPSLRISVFTLAIAE